MAGDTRHLRPRSPRRSLIVGLVLLAGASAGCGSPTVPTPAATVTIQPRSPAPAAVVPSEVPPEVRCLEFQARLVTGFVEVASRFERFGDSVAESGSAVKDAAEAINDWAIAEQHWMRGHDVDARYKDAYIAYSSAIDSMFYSSLSLTMLLLDPESASRADIENVSRRMNASLSEIGAVVGRIDQTDCGRALPAVATIPPLALPDDPADAYLALATQLNARYSEILDARSTSTTFRADLFALEDSASAWLAMIEFPPNVSDDVTALEAALASAVFSLDFASDDEISLLLIGAFTDGGVGPLRDQRTAAAAIRERLGLPPMAESDFL